jgi:hypothetical protein
MSAIEQKTLLTLNANTGAGYSDCQSMLVVVLVIFKQ